MATSSQSPLLKRMGASIIGTSIAEIITLPICTAKTILQNSTLHTNGWQTIKYIYHNHGIRYFYRPAPAAIASQVLSSSTKFALYRFGTDQYPKVWTPVIGIASGIVSSLICHPFDVIRSNLQMNRTMKEMPFLYKAYSKSLAKTVVGSSLFLPLFDFFSMVYSRGNNMEKKDGKNGKNGWSTTLASMTTAVVSTIITHPIDYLKTRQSVGSDISFLYHEIRNNLGIQSLKNMYKGLSLNLMRIVPHFTIMMTITTYLANEWKL